LPSVPALLTATKFAREEQWLTLEEIHWRLSALPAFCAGLRDHSFLREGAPADIVVYDLDAVRVRPVEIMHDLPGGRATVPVPRPPILQNAVDLDAPPPILRPITTNRPVAAPQKPCPCS
jgi:N-acyl-D-aspartate/D-glutamate deacylase